eukprot:1184704-Prorocentrum_minimum.AAC.6
MPRVHLGIGTCTSRTASWRCWEILLGLVSCMRPPLWVPPLPPICTRQRPFPHPTARCPRPYFLARATRKLGGKRPLVSTHKPFALGYPGSAG